MDIYPENVDSVGQPSSRPDEFNPVQQHSTASGDFRSINSGGGPLRASPTHFDDSYRGVGSQPIPLPLPVATEGPDFLPRRADMDRFDYSPRRADTDRKSNVDWIVPLSGSKHTTTNTAHREKTFGERLGPTLKEAEEARARYARKALLTGYALNVAIGMQVVLGSLTTALSAATSGKQTSIAVSILGGLSTLTASYLARARGSNEPELSTIRVKDLDQFIRECEAFSLDSGHLDGHEYDDRVIGFRNRFEELLGNANGERRLAAV